MPKLMFDFKFYEMTTHPKRMLSILYIFFSTLLKKNIVKKDNSIK